MKPALHIIRGLPGAGKTTLANTIVSGYTDRNLLACAVEADQFFLSSNGHKEIYEFDRRFLGAAHDECYGRTFRYLRLGYSVAVANTFTTRREIQRYVTGLDRTGMVKSVDLHVIKCVGNYKSIHNVPSKAVDKMRDRWEDWYGEAVFDGVFDGEPS